MITVSNNLGGHFALSTHTPRPEISGLRGNRYYRGRRLRIFTRIVFQKEISATFAK